MTTPLTRRAAIRVAGTIGGVGALGVSGCLGDSDVDGSPADEPLAVASARQFAAPTCQCCERYAGYLQEHLRGDLELVYPEDLAAVKRDHGVPGSLQSCHTLVVDGYVVEGHVPVAGIAKLLDEEPAIDGIALPGMPAGSPGMGGEKSGPFTLYVVDGAHSGAEYATI